MDSPKCTVSVEGEHLCQTNSILICNSYFFLISSFSEPLECFSNIFVCYFVISFHNIRLTPVFSPSPFPMHLYRQYIASKNLTLIVPCFSLALNYHKLWLFLSASEFVLVNILGNSNSRQVLIDNHSSYSHQRKQMRTEGS